MKGLTRREFLAGVGAFGVISASRGRFWPQSLAFQALYFTFHPEPCPACQIVSRKSYHKRCVNHRPTYFRRVYEDSRSQHVPVFIGVGETGCRLGHAVMGYPSEFCFVDLPQDPKQRLEPPLVILSGQGQDPMFWLARKKVLAQDPYLILSFVDGEFPLAPEANEGVIRIRHDDLTTPCLTILHLLSIPLIPSCVGVDVADMKTVLAGGFLEVFHFARKKDVQKILPFRSLQGVMTILCYRDPDSVSLADFESFLRLVERNPDEPVNYVAVIDCSTQTDSELVVFNRV